ncbi:MAG: AlkZ family DNA glycosylase [Ignavibacteriales bacterium]|nr:AlkZ family DNA glycosylase [Ignavibacteriales bacterium]
MNITRARLSNHFLGIKKCRSATDVVAWLGAVQAQDFSMAKWGIALRMKGATDVKLDEAFNTGAILRAHVMRPTWHFVMPEDIRWMQELTAPRVRIILSHYDRKLDIDRKLIQKTNALFTKVLRNKNFRTRNELAEILKKNGVAASGQKLAHIVMHAELDAVICSGPRLGKQLSYALVDERAPKTTELDRDESLARLALKYFQSHGPAQIKDFAWWSGLTMQEAQKGLDFASLKLEHDTIDDKEYWFSPETEMSRLKSPTASLHSIFDEYIVAYKDRSALGGGKFAEKLLSLGNALTSVLIIDGEIAATWKRIVKKDTVEITVNPLRQLRKGEKEAVAKAVEQFGKYLEMECRFSFR